MNFKQLLLLALLLLGLLNDTAAQKRGLTPPDSLQLSLDGHPLRDTIRLGLLALKSRQLLISAPQEALVLIDEMHSIAIALKIEKWEIEAIGLRCIFYIYTGQMDSARQQAKLGLQRSLAAKYLVGQSANYMRLGIADAQQGDFLEAINNYQQAIKIATGLKNKLMVTNVLINLGNIYYQLDDYSKSREQYLLALNNAKEIGNNALLPSIYNNIGISYTEQAAYAQAMPYFKEALDYGRALHNAHSQGITYVNLSDAFVKQDQYMKACENAEKGIDIGRMNNDYPVLANCMINLGLALAKMPADSAALYARGKGDRFVYANALLDTAVSLATKIKDKKMMANALKYRSDVEAVRGLNTKAYETLIAYQRVHDSLLNDANKNILTRGTLKYELCVILTTRNYEHFQKTIFN